MVISVYSFAGGREDVCGSEQRGSTTLYMAHVEGGRSDLQKLFDAIAEERSCHTKCSGHGTRGITAEYSKSQEGSSLSLNIEAGKRSPISVERKLVHMQQALLVKHPIFCHIFDAGRQHRTSLDLVRP